MGAAALPVAVGMQGLSGLNAAQQQRAAGKASEDYMGFLAGQAEINAKLAIARGERESRDAQDKGAFDARRLAEQVDAQHATTKVALAANGIALNSVTAEDLTNDTITRAGMDEMMIRYNADSRSKDAIDEAKFEAEQLASDARIKRIDGAAAAKASLYGAQATLLGTAGNAASTWYMGSKYRSRRPRARPSRSRTPTRFRRIDSAPRRTGDNS